MTLSFDALVEKARAVPIGDELARRPKIKLTGKGANLKGPCPICGGEDRFSVNFAKSVFNCRGCGMGGDTIKFVQFLDGVTFKQAIEILTGERAPVAIRNDSAAKTAPLPARPRAKKVTVATFDYEDENGALLFQVERVEYQNPDGSWVLKEDGKRKKDFLQKRPDPNQPGRWLWNIDGVRKIPYRFPQLIEALNVRSPDRTRPVLIVEGERKVDLLLSWGFVATCCSMGAEHWTREHAECLSAAEDVIVLPDNDRAGRKYLDTVAASMEGIGPLAKVLDLPGLPPKGDILDWAAAGGTAERLHEFIAHHARPWAPSNGADYYADVTRTGGIEPFHRRELLRDEQKPTNAVKILTYTEMVAMPPVDWLVDYIIPRRSKSVLFGPSNSFKSFAAIDLACSVATGRSFHGNAVKQCKVIYVANEGANGVGRKRIPAWMAYHGIPVEERQNIFLVPVETILPNGTSRNNLLAAIRAIVAPGEDFFLPIDVLRGTMTGSESDDEAAAAWTSAAEILITEGGTLLAVTHSPYSDDGRARGHSHLWGSFDTRLQSEGDKEKRTSLLKVERHKEHDSGGQWGFRLDEAEVEEHPGETSLVPRLDADVRSKAARSKVPQQNRFLLEIVAQTIGEAGEPIKAFGVDGPMVKAAANSAVRSRYYARIAEQPEPGETPERLAARQRQVFRRAVKAEIEAKRLVAWLRNGERFLWLP